MESVRSDIDLERIHGETAYLANRHRISPFIRFFDVVYDLVELLLREGRRPSACSYFIALRLPHPLVVLNRTFLEA
jgi:hypothetical protein